MCRFSTFNSICCLLLSKGRRVPFAIGRSTHLHFLKCLLKGRRGDFPWYLVSLPSMLLFPQAEQKFASSLDHYFVVLLSHLKRFCLEKWCTFFTRKKTRKKARLRIDLYAELVRHVALLVMFLSGILCVSKGGFNSDFKNSRPWQLFFFSRENKTTLAERLLKRVVFRIERS